MKFRLGEVWACEATPNDHETIISVTSKRLHRCPVETDRDYSYTLEGIHAGNLHGENKPGNNLTIKIREAPAHYAILSKAMELAEAISALSPCNRLKVGCVLLDKDDFIVGLGFNGPMPGMPGCHPDTCNCDARCFNTVHAEIQALHAAKGALPVRAAVTHEPCLNCAKALALVGVKEVLFRHPYHSEQAEERHLKAAILAFYDVKVTQVPDLDKIAIHREVIDDTRRA